MSEKILIVDDEPMIRSSIRCYLEDQGYIALAARNGAEALEMFESENPNLVLLDLRLPKMDGLEILREIRKSNADVPVIIVSGAGQLDDVVQALRLGAWDYLLKPIRDLNILKHSVQTCLERARLIRENQTYRSHLEEMVAQRTAELEAANTSLQRKTVTLEEVLATYRVDSDRRVARAIERISQFSKPALDEIRKVLPAAHRKLADRIEAAISDAASESVDKLANELSALSPAELRVCDMIRRGMGSKEIAAATGISVETVETHRRNIRRKLKITNESVNLSTFLHQLAGPGAGRGDGTGATSKEGTGGGKADDGDSLAPGQD